MYSEYNVSHHDGADPIQTQCLTNNFRYAYFTASSNLPETTAGQSACSCSDIQPPIKGFTRTVDTVGDYTCNTPTDFQAFLLRTTNRFDGCSQGGNGMYHLFCFFSSYTSLIRETDNGPLQYGTQPTFESCLAYCVNYDTIYMQAVIESDSVWCWCQTGAFPDQTRCGTGDEDNYYTT